MRPIVAVVVVCVAVAGCAGKPHPPSAVSARVISHGRPPAWLLRRAHLAARSLGDAHPEKIELYAAGADYRIRLWGRFTCGGCSRPYGSRPITGGVATFVYRGHTEVLSSFSLSPRRLVAAADATAPVVREWRAALVQNARSDPSERFASPPLAVLRARLARAARRYRFAVDLVLLRRPRGLAPQIVIRSGDRRRLAKAIGPIMNVVDPPPWNHRVYEGILIEAVDDSGVPYAIAFNALRGHIEGGQWASSPALYPFPHG